MRLNAELVFAQVPFYNDLLSVECNLSRHSTRRKPWKILTKPVAISVSTGTYTVRQRAGCHHWLSWIRFSSRPVRSVERNSDQISRWTGTVSDTFVPLQSSKNLSAGLEVWKYTNISLAQKNEVDLAAWNLINLSTQAVRYAVSTIHGKQTFYLVVIPSPPALTELRCFIIIIGIITIIIIITIFYILNPLDYVDVHDK